MALKKKYVKTKPVCKVSFSLPGQMSNGAKAVFLVGDFNGWDEKATPMRKLKDGSFSVTLDLAKDMEYQFRYLVDGQQWENDDAADRYVPTPFGDADNSVVIV